MTSRYPELTSARDIAAVVSVLKDPADDDTVRHEAANLLARSGHRELVKDLLAVLNNPKEGERFRALDRLAARDFLGIWMSVDLSDLPSLIELFFIVESSLFSVYKDSMPEVVGSFLQRAPINRQIIFLREVLALCREGFRNSAVCLNTPEMTKALEMLLKKHKDEASFESVLPKYAELKEFLENVGRNKDRKE